MSLGYKPNKCENCGRMQSGSCTGCQLLLLLLLTCLFVIPGIIYYFCASPSRCHICGLKRKHRNNSSNNNLNGDSNKDQK